MENSVKNNQASGYWSFRVLQDSTIELNLNQNSDIIAIFQKKWKRKADTPRFKYRDISALYPKQTMKRISLFTFRIVGAKFNTYDL